MNLDKIFYSVLKDEDATPFVGNNVIIVADGLGGSGSNVHEIKTDKDKSLHDSIVDSAFNDFDKATYENSTIDFQEYLDHWVDPMADDKSDTSALWASRIAIARCAYALCYHQDFRQRDLSDEKARKELAEFISKGLRDTKEHFHLQRGKYDDQKILPTTLAFIRYNTDKKGVTTAEVVWAGDSRCYLLSQAGLKQLSSDDEDQSGAITNLFYVGESPTVLNYRKYTIKEPCVLIGASDGIFDPFEPHDNFGVEWILLKSIREASSYEDLMSKLEKFYDGVHSDDATMAFVPVGFDDFGKLKESLLERNQYIEDMWKDYCETKSELETVNSSEDDVRGYVASRTRDKLSSIMTTILKNYNNSDDCVYTEEVRKTIDKVKENVREERVQESLDNLQTAIKSDEEDKIQVGDIFNNNLAGLPNDVIKSIEAVKNSYTNLHNARTKKSKMEERDKEKDKYIEIIKKRAAADLEELNNLSGDDKKLERRIMISNRYNKWLRFQKYFEKIDPKKCGKISKELKTMYNNEDDKKEITAIQKFIDSYNKKYKELSQLSKAELDTDISKKKEEYKTAIVELFTVLKGYSSDYEKIFTSEVVQQYYLATPNQNDVDDNIEDEVKTFVTEHKEEIVSAIVEALSNNCDKESMIDGFYNATRLGAFRTYYRLKNKPNTDIKEFEAKLKKLEEEYSQPPKD